MLDVEAMAVPHAFITLISCEIWNKIDCNEETTPDTIFCIRGTVLQELRKNHYGLSALLLLIERHRSSTISFNVICRALQYEGF